MPQFIGTNDADSLNGTPGSINVIDGRGGADILTGADDLDYILGGDGDDVIQGGDEQPVSYPTVLHEGDVLDGAAGNDTVHGGAGADALSGGTGSDALFGGEGADVIYGNGGFTNIAFATYLTYPFGGPYPTVPQTAFSVPVRYISYDVDGLADDGAVDTISGGGGNDIVHVGLGDIADGGTGSDRLNVSFAAMTQGITLNLGTDPRAALQALSGGSYANFEIYGASGTRFADTFIAGSASAVLSGGDGDDVLIAGSGNISFDGGAGRDTVDYSQATAGVTGYTSSNGNAGVEDLIGSGFNDFLFGDAGVNVIRGGGGADRISGGGGADLLLGEAGADDFRYETAGNSSLAASDMLGDFQSGLDTLTVSSSNDRVAIQMSDTGLTEVFYSLSSGAYQGRIVSANIIQGADIRTGAAGVDVFGSLAGQVLIGGTGADTLIGRGGADILAGGAGADTFFYEAASDSAFAARDRIIDFQSGVDRLHLFFADAGQVAIRYVSDHTEVYFGNDGSGNFAGMIEVYGSPVLASDILTSASTVYIAASSSVLEATEKPATEANSHPAFPQAVTDISGSEAPYHWGEDASPVWLGGHHEVWSFL